MSTLAADELESEARARSPFDDVQPHEASGQRRVEDVVAHRGGVAVSAEHAPVAVPVVAVAPFERVHAVGHAEGAHPLVGLLSALRHDAGHLKKSRKKRDS